MPKLSRKAGRRVLRVLEIERISGGRQVVILLACGHTVRRPACRAVPGRLECPIRSCNPLPMESK